MTPGQTDNLLAIEDAHKTASVPFRKPDSSLQGVLLVSVYAPTLSAPQEVKDKFYDELEVKNFHRARPKGPPRVDSSKAADPTKAAAFLSALEESFPRLPQCCSAQQYWDGLRDTIHRSALTVFAAKVQ
ncbi:hypothetical protein D4764_03G0004970 [Takifugu flavidus]|uniref:Uncharacterized protein n=1 Tax=Takifugu flavidus TaxID=433684 RepID=A0A5C6N9F3_9TELE|nr:hypothetical protein D4764_03G0004970 [Takifugu flavidus]